MKISQKQLSALVKASQKASKNSYSPYSKKKIGAALLLENKQIVTGCNIENASYGGTVCAERVALWKCLSENPKAKVTDVAVFSNEQKPWSPCGMCRQVMVEFCDIKTRIHLVNKSGIQKTFTLGELLPEAFNTSDLI